MMSLKHILYLLHVSVLVATIASSLPEKSRVYQYVGSLVQTSKR